MSNGFTASLRTAEQLKAELRELDMTTLPAMTRMVKLMWAEKYSLPPNDERLLSLTLKEAAEQVFEQEAFKTYARERWRSQNPEFEDWGEPEVETHTGEAAKKIADTPHLTGDPEWDAIELAETDPRRPLLSERQMG